MLVSPLMLETLQRYTFISCMFVVKIVCYYRVIKRVSLIHRYIEAVTPVLAELHPSAIVDGLHFQCSTTVKAQNRLKKRASKEEVAERKDDKEGAPWTSAESPQSPVSLIGRSKTSRVQVKISSFAQKIPQDRQVFPISLLLHCH